MWFYVSHRRVKDWLIFCLTFRTTASRGWMVGVAEVMLSLVTGCCSRSFEDPRVGEAEAEHCISNPVVI